MIIENGIYAKREEFIAINADIAKRSTAIIYKSIKPIRMKNIYKIAILIGTMITVLSLNTAAQVIVQHPTNDTICEGIDDASFTVVPDGDIPQEDLSYQWEYTDDTTNIPSWVEVPENQLSVFPNGGQEQTLVIQLPLSSNTFGIMFYRCVVDAGEGGSDTSWARKILYHEPPSADAGSNGGTCVNEDFSISDASVQNESSFSWEVLSGAGDLSSSSVINPTYTPDASDAGTTVQLVLTAVGAGECLDETASDTVEIIVDAVPVAIAGDDGEICINEDFTIENASVQNESSFSWEITSGNGTLSSAVVINPTYTPDPTDAGTTVQLTLTAVGEGECTGESVSDVVEIAIDPLPVANAGDDGEICVDQDFSVTNASVENESSFGWEITTGNGQLSSTAVINPTYTPDASDAGTTVQLTLTAEGMGECSEESESDMVEIEIQGLPAVNAGSDHQICETETFTFSDASNTNCDYIEWETSGTGTFDDENMLFATYSPSNSDKIDGMVILTITGYPISPCTGDISDEMTLSITNEPTVYAGEDTTICQTDFIQISGMVVCATNSEWSTSGDGTFEDATADTTIYYFGTEDIQNEGVDLTLLAEGTNNTEDAITITIIRLPEASAGEDQAICEGSDIELANAMANFYNTLEWTSTGDGSFDDNALENPVYTPGSEDISNGTVTLTLTASAISPCENSVSDDIVFTIHPLPYVSISGENEVCANSMGMPYTAYIPGNYNTEWSVENGTFKPVETNDTIIVDWDNLPNEMGKVKLIATNETTGCTVENLYLVSFTENAAPDPPTIVEKYNDDVNHPYVLICTTPDYNYQWYRDGVSLPGETNQFYYPGDETTYDSIDAGVPYSVEVMTDDLKCSAMSSEYIFYPPDKSVEFESVDIFQVYPNPSNGQFVLSLKEKPDLFQNEACSFKVLDFNGKILFEREVLDDRFDVNLNNLEKGIYIAELTLPDMYKQVKKIIIY
jgi:hypothetical protein